MLNIPYCINNTNIPVEMSLTAPYKALRDLELVVELSRASCERIAEFDAGKISQADIDTNSCSDMQTKFTSIKKYCGICKFSESNVLGRLTDELVLLNYTFHHGLDERISIEHFKYYYLDQNFNSVPITRLLFDLIVENFDAGNDLTEILLEWCKDNERVYKLASPMIEKITDDSIFNVEKSIEQLNKNALKRRTTKHTDVLSLLISNQNLVDQRKELKNKRTQTPKAEKKPKSKSKVDPSQPQKFPGQLSIFTIDTSDSETLPQYCIDKSSSPKSIENNSLEVNQTTISDRITSDSIVITSNSYLSIDEINTLSIVAGTVFITTIDELNISIQGNNGIISSFCLDYEQHDTKDFIKLLFMNKNVIKIIDDLCNLKNFISVQTFNSTLDISIISKDTNIIDFYYSEIKNFTVDQLESFKKANILKIICRINVSEKSNAVFKVDGQSDILETVLLNAHKSKLMDKYNVLVSKFSRSALEIFVGSGSKSIVVDYFLLLIRNELRRNNLNIEIEVIMR